MANPQEQSGLDAEGRAVAQQLLHPDDVAKEDDALPTGDTDSVEGEHGEDSQDDKSGRKKRPAAWEAALAKQDSAHTRSMDEVKAELASSRQDTRTAQGQTHALQTLIERRLQQDGNGPAAEVPSLDAEDPAAVAQTVQSQAARIQRLERAVSQTAAVSAEGTERQQWLTWMKDGLAAPLGVDWPAIEQELRGVPVADLATRGAELITKAKQAKAGETDLDTVIEERAGAMMVAYLKRTGQYEGVVRGARAGGSGGGIDIGALQQKYKGNTEGFRNDPQYQKWLADAK